MVAIPQDAAILSSGLPSLLDIPLDIAVEVLKVSVLPAAPGLTQPYTDIQSCPASRFAAVSSYKQSSARILDEPLFWFNLDCLSAASGRSTTMSKAPK